MDFFTRFCPAPSKGFSTEGKSLTQQQFRDDCDINVLIKRYSEPHTLPLQAIKSPRVPLWGDFSEIPDIREAHGIFTAAEVAFANLPSDVRARFQNNPLELLAFVSDKANRAEAEKLGLIDPAVPVASVVGEAPSVSAVNKETIESQ